MKTRNTAYNRTTVTCLSAAIALSVLLAGCGNSPQPSTAAKPSSTPTSNSNTASTTTNTPTPAAKIKVVTAENFLGEAASAVGGDRVEVTSIINSPDTDPHSFEPTADTSKAVSDAQVVVYVGIGYDQWMDKLLKASSSSSSKTVIELGGGLLGKKDGDNPHVWYDPTSMPKLADDLADKLAKVDPSQADAFKKRAQDYKTSLAPLNDLVQQVKQTSPTPIAVSEPVFEYMAEALNFNPINPKFAKAIEEEADPSPADIAALQNDIKDKKIKFFVQNTQVASPTVKNMVDLASKSGISIVHVTETEPQGKNYVQWMTDQLNEIKNAIAVK
jgi:zinc/manganese transport system substrate-binding protein